ncbi:MAG TPA: HAD hydrolase-like protein, partial [Cyclobacteriaceae bacterium]|nr:HAD hydrolase-like protein [Cyclobacteriaceae bacterium]
MSNYHTILFDLDHTLWDYESNSRTTLLELYHHYGLYTLGVDSPEDFISTFEKINRELWDQYDHGEIDRTYIKEKRFAFIFDMFSVRNNALALKISQEYIEACPRKGKLLPHAMATLEYLSSKYQLGLITNGFEDVQSTKLECAGIRNFFA